MVTQAVQGFSWMSVFIHMTWLINDDVLSFFRINCFGYIIYILFILIIVAVLHMMDPVNKYTYHYLLVVLFIVMILI